MTNTMRIDNKKHLAYLDYSMAYSKWEEEAESERFRRLWKESEVRNE